MVSHRVAPRVASCFYLVLPFFVFVACAKRTPEPSTKKPAEITLPANGSQKAFDQIEKDLAQFESGQSHDAECQGCRAPVTIHSTGLTKDIKGASGPVKMRIVALVNNTSSEPVEHTPSRTIFKANTKYLVWVHSGIDKKATWGFIELGPAYTANPQPIGVLKHCGHKASLTDDAYFMDCADKPLASRWIKTAYASTKPPAAAISKPVWIACDPDCCTGT